MVRGLLSAGRLVAWLALLVPLALASACASPTLPLPPPETPDLAPGVDTDHVTLSGACNSADPNAVIVIVNTNPGVPDDKAVSGAIVGACGSWDASVYAHNGDVLDITEEIGTTRSQPLTFQVQE
ncbi:MAG: hypothetical protein ACRELB_23715 [Polyangiaceae bacterium]